MMNRFRNGDLGALKSKPSLQIRETDAKKTQVPSEDKDSIYSSYCCYWIMTALKEQTVGLCNDPLTS